MGIFEYIEEIGRLIRENFPVFTGVLGKMPIVMVV